MKIDSVRIVVKAVFALLHHMYGLCFEHPQPNLKSMIQ